MVFYVLYIDLINNVINSNHYSGSTEPFPKKGAASCLSHAVSCSAPKKKTTNDFPVSYWCNQLPSSIKCHAIGIFAHMYVSLFPLLLPKFKPTMSPLDLWSPLSHSLTLSHQAWNTYAWKLQLWNIFNYITILLKTNMLKKTYLIF